MDRNKISRYLALTAVTLLLALLYNNCGKGQSAESSDSASLVSYDLTYNADNICAEEEIRVFARGYHTFLSTTCKSCHVSGPGKGTFASADVNVAYQGFTQIGYDKISQYAVSNSHNPPYTGTQNLELINNYRLQWQAFQTEKARCAGGSGSPSSSNQEVFTPQFETTTQAIPPLKATTTTGTVNDVEVEVTTYDRKVLTWDLSNTLSSRNGKALPNLTGVQLSVTVTGFKAPSGETAYVITLPMLKAGTSSLHVKGLNFRINGFPVNYATTFKEIDVNAYLGTTQLLSPGSLVAVGPLGTQDTLSVQLGDIEIVTLQAPPPPPSVQFSVSSMTIQPTQLGYANKVTVQVTVTGDNVSPISVPVNVATSAQYATGERPAVSIVGVGQNRFDWDYRFDPDTSTSLNFNAGQKTASFNIIFSDDQRDDVDKVLRLTLGTPLGAVLGTASTLRISLPDYNPAYTGTAPTFAQLMNSRSGILGVSCVKCHNSVQKQGGYDMTDYEDMKARGIILPGNMDPNQHKMFRRMNADAPNLEGLQSMPLDGFLPRDQVDLVNQWILGGARNN